MTTTPEATWRLAAVDSLRHHPRNLATHDERNHEVVRSSLEDWGQVQNLVVQAGTGVVIAGNCRLDELRELGAEEAMVCEVDCDDDEADRLAAVLNRSEELRGWEPGTLAATLKGWRDGGADIGRLGWDESDFKAVLRRFNADGRTRSKGDNDLPPIKKGKPSSVTGEVYELGRHRLLCGDSTDATHLAALMAGDVATLINADPPYGMGKEAEGVANDNLRRSKLDAFQMAWWAAWRTHVADNGSAYIWGVAEDLWRLWYVGGLGESEDEINVRTEIVWSKGGAKGIGNPDQRRLAPGTERCLLIMLCRQHMASINADEFPPSFEPLRAYLDNQRAIMDWGPADTKRITGTGMHSHWFSTSQWGLPTAPRYAAMQAAAGGRAFLRSYDSLRADYEADDSLDLIREAFYAARGHFDHGHDDMTDLWTFDRVSGEDRHGHPTPKPVAMVERAILTSTIEGDIVAVPFGGSCPEIIAAERTGRTVRAAELKPVWVDVIRRRWTAWALANDIDPGPGALE